jgi:hypothetical protein
VAVDAVHRELVSALRSPDIREIYREFLEIPYFDAILIPHQRAISIVCS